MRTALTEALRTHKIITLGLGLIPEDDDVVFDQPISHALADDATYLDYIRALKDAADDAFYDILSVNNKTVQLLAGRSCHSLITQ